MKDNKNLNFIIAVSLVILTSLFIIRMGQLLAASAEQEVKFVKQRYHFIDQYAAVNDH